MKWNFEEFRIYLLLEASHADMVFSKEEQEIITSKIDKDSYRKLYDEFTADSEYERIQKITEAAGFYCDTAEKKMELVENIKTIFEADGVVDQMERNLMLFLKKMI